MTPHTPCGAGSHLIARRQMLGGLLGSVTTAGALAPIGQAELAAELTQSDRQMLIIFLDGAVSQLESWDPKDATDTGGPFQAISTSQPGVSVSELLPHTSQQLHHLLLVRGVNTKENNHAKGKYLMTKGRRQEPSTDYPDLGAVTSRLLTRPGARLPGFVHLEDGRRAAGKPTSSGQDAAYLGPRYGSLVIGDCQPPEHSSPLAGQSPESDRLRRQFRQRLNQRFARRGNAATRAFAASFEQAEQLMANAHVFDVSKEPAADHQRYGTHGFAQNCLMARRLLEHGVTCVKVMHTNYDTHNENFNHHLEQLGEFDRPFAALIEDLALRGLLEKTLVVVTSEFGRTPKINSKFGRDHWSNAWSLALAGCGIKAPGVFGRTNDNGTEVVEHEVDHRQLFHTFLKAVGADTRRHFDVNGRPIPVADPAAGPIEEILA